MLVMFLTTLLLVAAGSQAESNSRQKSANLPQFDSRRFCEAIAANGGGQPSVISGCLEHEDLARERMKADVPEPIRSHCIEREQAMPKGGSYMSFNGCVERETQRADWSRVSRERRKEAGS
jgi:hypothetical protein